MTPSWLAAESRRMKRSVDRNDWEMGELQLPCIMLQQCDWCGKAVSPLQIVRRMIRPGRQKQCRECYAQEPAEPVAARTRGW